MAFAKYKLRNINQKLTVFVGGSIAIALTILGVVAVSYTSNLASDQVHVEVARMLEANAQEVKRFFAERAKIVTTLLADPRLENYFEATGRDWLTSCFRWFMRSFGPWPPAICGGDGLVTRSNLPLWFMKCTFA